MTRLYEEVSRSLRYGRPITLGIMQVYSDSVIDGGSEYVSKQVAQALNRSTRTSDIIGKLSGKKTGLIFPETEAKGAETAAERLRQQIEYSLKEDASGEVINLTTRVMLSPLTLPDSPEYNVNREEVKTYIDFVDRRLAQQKEGQYETRKYDLINK